MTDLAGGTPEACRPTTATRLQALNAAATVAPWTHEVACGENAQYEGDSICMWWDDGTGYYSIVEEMGRSDAALIVALRNAYADGTLVAADPERDKRVAALVAAAENAIAKNAVFIGVTQVEAALAALSTTTKGGTL